MGCVIQCNHKHKFLYFFTRRCGQKMTIFGGGSCRGFYRTMEKAGWFVSKEKTLCPKHTDKEPVDI